MNAHVNVTDTDNPDPLAPYETATPHVEFTQLCCGPSVSVVSPSSMAPTTAETGTETETETPTQTLPSSEDGNVTESNISAVENLAPFEEKQDQEVEGGDDNGNVNGDGVGAHNEPMDNYNYTEGYGEGYGYGYEYTPPAVSYDFPLYTNKGRVFVSTVVNDISEPHCGMLYVGGNVSERKQKEREIEANNALPPDEQQHIDLVEYSAVTSMLRLEEVYDLEIYLSNSDEYRIPMVVQDAWTSLKTLLLADRSVILHTNSEGESEQESNVNNQHSAPQQEYSFEVKTIYKAVFEVCRRCDGLFTKCHALYQQDQFGGGVMYNTLKNNMLNYQHYREVNKCTTGIATMLINMFQWLLRELPNNMRSMFPNPSPFLMKRFWVFFAENYCVEYYAHIGQDRDTTVSLNEIALLTLHTDSTLFVRLCCEGLRCIALFVQVADEYGVTHYNQW